MDKAVRTLHNDLQRYRKAEGTEKKHAAAEAKAQQAGKADVAGEAKALNDVAAQKQAILDQFASPTPPDAATAQKLAAQMYALGEKAVQTKDVFDTRIAGDKTAAKKDAKAVATDAKAVKADKKKALHDLTPAEYKMNLKDTNSVRKELGLKAVKKVVRAPESKGLSKAVQIAMSAVHLEQSSHCYDYTQLSGRTNYGRSPTTKGSNGRITFDCSGFVGAVYKAAGLPSPYTVGYTGTSFDVAGCKNMQKVSGSQAKPGDVVVFPDHIALYIGGGKCISMGQEGEPAVVTVAAEAAYHNRGIQGFYHPKGS